ncbi:MAG: NAD-dependent epimerase/dehydratase family protein [Alcanivorax sp.]|jgi:UDP-glucose 4-epimerase
MNKTVLLTGASGFIGSHLVGRLSNDADLIVRSLLRGTPEKNSISASYVKCFSHDVDFSQFCDGVDIVVHAAGIAEISQHTPINILLDVNVGSTLSLAKAAAAAGVSRFIFISTMKVNGDINRSDRGFSEDDDVHPLDDYSKSKASAELGLFEIAKDTGMQVVIIRPPLVYGQGVKANFKKLLRLAKSPFPLPFSGINNRRSMVYVGNLIDFISLCISYPFDINGTFIVTDGNPVSINQVIKQVRLSLGVAPRLFYLPHFFFLVLGFLLRKKTNVDQLISDCYADTSKANDVLNWTPPFSFSEGIKMTVSENIKRNY